MFGSHLSVAGSMCNALAEAELLGMDTVQVFTKNQQQWAAKPLDPALVTDWLSELKKLGWQSRTVSHASYLINLASCKDDLFAKSVDLMTDEVERCEALSIPFLVHHPGSFVGWTLEQGIARIAAGYKELFKRTKGFKTVLCIEGTTGSGSHIGGPFEHLRDLRGAIVAATGEPGRVGFCLDTCHLHAAGHDMSTRKAAKESLARFDELCGLRHVRVLHMNDSKGALGTKLDRHEHIGEGQVGGQILKLGNGEMVKSKAGTAPRGRARSSTNAESRMPNAAPPKPAKAPPAIFRFSASRLADSGFAEVVNAPFAAKIPKILETPKEDAKMAAKIAVKDRLDSINLARLRALLAR